MSRKKREVRVTINQAEDSEITTAGGNIGKKVGGRDNTSSNVVVELTNLKHVTVTTAGLDIERFNQIAEPLDELVGLLTASLNNRDDKEYVQEISSDLLEQAQKPDQEKNQSKIRGLINNLGSYISLATLAATQVDKAQQLIEKVQHLLTGG